MKVRFTSIIAMGAMSLSLISCGGGGTVQTETTLSGGTTSEAVESAEYEFTENYGGAEIKFLNNMDSVSGFAQLDRPEMTGDAYDDALYKRCRTVEEKLGIKLVEELTNYGPSGTEILDTERKVILSGDDIYEFIYVPTEQNALTLGLEGGLYDLLVYDELKLDEPWWFGKTNEMAVYDGKLWAASGSSHLMQLDATWVVFFNEDMMTDLGLELPYKMVRDGKWTIDRLIEYAKKGANLNGDDTFAFNGEGSATYGISLNSNSVLHMLYGLGEYMIGEEDGKTVITAGTDRFYQATDKMFSLFSEEGLAERTSKGDHDPGSFQNMFYNQRSMMFGGKITYTNNLRDKDFTFGIVPYPKLDENQDSYVSSSNTSLSFAIPITCDTPERSAVIADALSYLGYRDVIPAWRELNVEQKGLRNDDSIEMLEIVFDTYIARPHTLYGVGLTAVSAIRDNLFNNEGNLASVIAANQTAFAEEVSKLGK